MKLVGKRKARGELLLATLAPGEDWRIEGDFIVVLKGPPGHVPHREGIRIPLEVTKIVEKDDNYKLEQPLSMLQAVQEAVAS